MNLIQYIKDFRKWREEKYKAKLELVCANITTYETLGRDEIFKYAFASGIVYGIQHRKEILKKVKI